MGEVYRAAQQVLIWLGPGTEGSKAVMAAIRSHAESHPGTPAPLTENATSNVIGVGPDGSVNPGARVQKPRYRPDLSADLKMSNEALDVLYRQDYWKRLWIKQEVLLGQQLMLQWGAEVVEWDNMVAWRNHLDDNDHFMTALTMTNLIRLHNERPKDGRYNMSWQHAYMIGQGSACLNPRDKVFGMLGLIFQPKPLTVDYERTLEEIWRDVMDNCANLLHDDWEANAIDGMWREDLFLSHDHVQPMFELDVEAIARLQAMQEGGAGENPALADIEVASLIRPLHTLEHPARERDEWRH